MKPLFLSLFIFSFVFSGYSQVGIGTTEPNPSSVLDISSTNKGVLVPRVSLNNVATSKLDGTNSAATGLLIYNTNTYVTGGNGVGFYYWTGAIWSPLKNPGGSNGGGGSTDDWSLSGNNITDDSRFLGTTSYMSLKLKVNNTRIGRFDPGGGFALGLSSSANNTFGVALGNTANASGDNSTAIGSFATSSATKTIAMGVSSSASGDNSVALGNGAITSGSKAFAIGNNSSSSGDSSVSLGSLAFSSGSKAFAFGVSSSASADNSIAFGNLSSASTSESIAIGKSAKALANTQTLAIGSSSESSGFQSVALGFQANASNNSALSLGVDSKASGQNSIALGSNANASAQYSTAIGYKAIATQTNTIILGNNIGDNKAKVGIGTSNPHDTSILEISSTDKGLLIPRMALTSTTNSSPVAGTLAESLLVYNTATAGDVTPGFYYWKDRAWKALAASSGSGSSPVDKAFGERYYDTDITIQLNQYDKVIPSSGTVNSVTTANIGTSGVGFTPGNGMGGVYRVTLTITYSKESVNNNVNSVEFYLTKNENRIANTEIRGDLNDDLKRRTLTMVKLINLEANQTYHFAISKTNPEGNNSIIPKIILHKDLTNMTIERIN